MNKKIVLICIISFLFLYLDFNFLLKAQMAKAARTGLEITKISNDLKGLDAGLENMEKAKIRQETTPASAGKKIIFESELTSLLHDISKLANANNVRMLQVRPSREKQKAASGKFTPVLINMDLVCGYHNFGRFVNALENNQAFVSVESFKIEPEEGDTSRQKVSLAVKTYVRK